MSDPLSLFPMALAAGGGRIDGFETRQLVAAGVTLLQRSAPLVRALSGRRAGILLPTGPAFITALAASDGRGAVLLNPTAAPSAVAWQVADAVVGAVFTVSALAPLLPAGLPLVLLDGAPRTARVVIDGATRDVDLGSHVGLQLEGSRDAEGRDEECVVFYEPAEAEPPIVHRVTHRQLIDDARSMVQALDLAPSPHRLAVLPFWEGVGLVTLGAALMSGGRVTTIAASTGD